MTYEVVVRLRSTGELIRRVLCATSHEALITSEGLRRTLYPAYDVRIEERPDAEVANDPRA